MNYDETMQHYMQQYIDGSVVLKRKKRKIYFSMFTF